MFFNIFSDNETFVYVVYRIPVIIVELVVNVLLIETCEYKQA